MNGSPSAAVKVLSAVALLALGAELGWPAGAQEGGSPGFVVEVSIEDSAGRAVAPDGVCQDDCPLTIEADVTLAEGRPDCACATLSLFINGALAHRFGLGPLYCGSAPDRARYSHRWSPPACGQYDIAVGVQDGDDADNRTLVTCPRLSVRSAGPDLGIASIAISPGAQFEGREVVVSAVIVNNGSGDSDSGAVEFRLADPAGGTSVAMGRLDGIDIPAGGSAQVGLSLTLPAAGNESDTRTVEAALDGSVLAAVPVTILKSRPRLVIESLAVPEGLRVGDAASLEARISNLGPVAEENVSVDFSDGELSLANEGPFDILAGETEEVRVRAVIPGPGDAVHVFCARARDAALGVRRFVGHRLSGASVEIAGFGVVPGTVDPAQGSSVQGLLLELLLGNTGELAGTVSVTIVDGEGRTVVRDNLVDARPQNTTMRRYTWLVKGGGRHEASVRVESEDRTETCVTRVDIPSARPEIDKRPLVAGGTAASLAVIGLLALAARRLSRLSTGPRSVFRRLRRPASVPKGERIDLEDRFDKRYAVGPRAGGPGAGRRGRFYDR